MSLEADLSEIQNCIDTLNVSMFFEKVKTFRNQYPHNNKINYLIDKNKKIFSKQSNKYNSLIQKIQKTENIRTALISLETVYNEDPNNPLINAIIGNLYGRLNSFSKAILFQEKAIKLNPLETSFYINLYKTLIRSGNIYRALPIILMAELVDPTDKNVALLAARTLFSNKHYKKSILKYEQLVKNDNKNNLLKFELCRQLLKLKQTDKITEMIENINDHKHLVEKYKILGLVKFHEGKNNLSKEFFYKALKLDEQNFKIYTYLAKCYEKDEEFDSAKSAHIQAYKNNKNDITVLKNYGTFYYKIGDLDRAEKYFLKANHNNPKNFEIIYGLSIIQLSKNDFHNGWLNYSFRWLSYTFNSNRYEINLPKFLCKKNFKSVYIWPEQGIGDQILFARFLNNIIFDNVKIFCTVNPKLIDLFEKSFPNVIFVNQLQNQQIESHIPIGDLGGLCLSSTDSLKKQSKQYLKPSKTKLPLVNSYLDGCRSKIQNKKICGLSWFSSNEDFGFEKSIQLKSLIPILKLEDYCFLDLQYGETLKDREYIKSKLGVEIIKFDFIDNFNDIDGLSTLINICDVIVTVSNSTAHLAGALGKKTFLLKSKGKGNIWYWTSDNRKSLWYPSINIFEQQQINKWDDVIDAVKKNL